METVLYQTVYKTKKVECLIPYYGENSRNEVLRWPSLGRTTVELRGRPIGILAAVKRDGELHFGYSIFNTNDHRFNRKMGKEIAMRRAIAHLPGEQTVLTFSSPNKWVDGRKIAGEPIVVDLNRLTKGMPSEMDAALNVSTDKVRSFRDRAAAYFFKSESKVNA